MAQYGGSYSPRPVEPPEARKASVWTIGFISFASVMMVILGTFHIINGLSAVIDDSFYVVREGFDLEIDTTTWGWLHILGGILLLAGSLGLLMGATWARVIAIFFAILSVIWNFYSIPYYPAWSILMMAVALGVIWALIFHGKDFAEGL
jgi:hypothetical protein